MTSRIADSLFVALVKGPERYVFVYTPETRGEALRTLGRFAFDWADATACSQRMREVGS